MNNFSKNFEEIDLEIHGVRLPRFEVSKDYVNKSKLKENLTISTSCGMLA